MIVDDAAAADLIKRLLQTAERSVQWRVQSPDGTSIVMWFTGETSVNPERSCRQWLKEHQTKFPNSEYCSYEVVRIVGFRGEDRLMMEAAKLLGYQESVTDEADS